MNQKQYEQYETLRDRLIEQSENPPLAGGTPQKPSVVGTNATLGFGYDLATRRGDPLGILGDLAQAGIELTLQQSFAILYYGGWDKEAIWNRYLRMDSTAGSGVAVEDRMFLDHLGAFDRTDAGLVRKLDGLLITKAQGEALLKLVVPEKERQLDALLGHYPAALERLAAPSAKRAALMDVIYHGGTFFGPNLLAALAAGEDAAAAFEIAFLSNKTPEKFSGIDERNIARAETFLGGALAPRGADEAGEPFPPAAIYGENLRQMRAAEPPAKRRRGRYAAIDAQCLRLSARPDSRRLCYAAAAIEQAGAAWHGSEAGGFYLARFSVLRRWRQRRTPNPTHGTIGAAGRRYRYISLSGATTIASASASCVR